MSEHTPDAAWVTPRHETTDVRSRPLMLSALVLAVAVALVCLFLIWFSRRLEAHARRHDPSLSPLVGSQSPPDPKLQTNPNQDLQRMHKAEERALSTYRWIDKERGVVQLPVDRAIDLLVAEGLPKTSADVPRVEPIDDASAQEDAR